MTTQTTANLVSKTLKGYGKLTWSIAKREVRTSYIASRGKPPADCYLLVPSDSAISSSWIPVATLESDIARGITKFAK